MLSKISSGNRGCCSFTVPIREPPLQGYKYSSLFEIFILHKMSLRSGWFLSEIYNSIYVPFYKAKSNNFFSPLPSYRFSKFGTEAIPTSHWSPFLGIGCPRMLSLALRIFGVAYRVWALIADILSTDNWSTLSNFYIIIFIFCFILLGGAVA
jgi:hypothetical protein